MSFAKSLRKHYENTTNRHSGRIEKTTKSLPNTCFFKHLNLSVFDMCTAKHRALLACRGKTRRLGNCFSKSRLRCRTCNGAVLFPWFCFAENKFSGRMPWSGPMNFVLSLMIFFLSRGALWRSGSGQTPFDLKFHELLSTGFASTFLDLWHLIVAYYYTRIFNPWVDVYSYEGVPQRQGPKLTNAFKDAYRYMDWLLRCHCFGSRSVWS